MINKDEKQTKLAFGTGDICITSGRFLNDDEFIGVVTFNNQSPREINSIGDIKAGQEYKLSDFPVIMTFTKTESIDVLINTLEQAKAEMLL